MAPSPSLLEINTRLWLGELPRGAGGPATLDDVPDGALDRIAALGFDWVWLLGVWRTGPASRRESLAYVRRHPESFAEVPGLTAEDVCGSPFAIRGYTVHPDFGGDAALGRFRLRLRDRGVRLMLDFVPNHVALDHPWLDEHPEYFVPGSAADLAVEPWNFRRIEAAAGPLVLAHGRDPYFPGWTDTLQLNYRHPALKRAMAAELAAVAGLCDGVRCDMAMLVLPDIFRQTWGDRTRPADGTAADDAPFWPAAIAGARRARPGFVLMAEAYWDREWTLQQQGFDFTYDKRLYDRLHALDAGAVRGHLRADGDYQARSARFLENHDEPRAADAFPAEVHRAAAVVTYLTAGLRFFHEGQLDGRRVRASVHLVRRPAEPADPAMRAFYGSLLAVIARPEGRSGSWQLLECRPAWDGNPTWARFLAFAREHEGRRLVVAVNYGPTRGQGFVPVPFADPAGPPVRFRDLLGPAVYDRAAGDLATRGLYLDLPPWGHHVFGVAVAPLPPEA